MSLPEKAHVLQLVVTLMGQSVGQGSILPATMTNHCRSLDTTGPGAVMELEAAQYSQGREVWHHILRLKAYGEERWAQRQKSQESKTASKEAMRPSARPREISGASRKAVPSQRRAQAGNMASRADFYAKPLLVGRGRWGLHFVVLCSDVMHRLDAPKQMPLRLDFTPLRAGGKPRGRKPDPACRSHGPVKSTDTLHARHELSPIEESSIVVLEDTRGTHEHTPNARVHRLGGCRSNWRTPGQGAHTGSKISEEEGNPPCSGCHIPEVYTDGPYAEEARAVGFASFGSWSPRPLQLHTSFGRSPTYEH